MTMWTDKDTYKEWDLEQPFIDQNGITYHFVGWLEPFWTEHLNRPDARPVLSRDPQDSSFADLRVLDPDHMTGWSQPEPEPDIPEPPVGSVVRDDTGDYWIRILSGWIPGRSPSAGESWDYITEEYGPLTLIVPDES